MYVYDYSKNTSRIKLDVMMIALLSF